MSITWEDLLFEPTPYRHYGSGIQAKLFFDNGFGVSVVQSSMSYGSKQGLYELAVIKGNSQKWGLCYTTPITDDVVGRLSKNEVMIYVRRVKDLPS